MHQTLQQHIPSLGQTSHVPSLKELNAQIRKLADMVKTIKDTEGCCLAETAKLRKDKEQLVRDLKRLDIASDILRHERDHFGLLLADEQLARERAEKEFEDLQKEIVELKQQLKVKKQKSQGVERMAGMKERPEALKKAMEDVLI